MTTTDLQALISIESVPAKVDANFDQLKAALDEKLAEYDTIVTADGVADAKKAATAVNKLKKQIAARRKEVADELKAPVAHFEGQMKALEQQCEDTRRGILNQADQYEDRVREQCADALATMRAAEWDRLDVPDEYRRAEYDDLVLISNTTPKGNLTKGAKETLASRVAENKALADKVALREAQIESRSYEAGLSAPLTIEHVRRFIEADDESYARELTRLIQIELDRERVAEQRRQEQAEREERARREAEERERKRQEAEQARREREQAEVQAETAQSPGEPDTPAPSAPEAREPAAAGAATDGQAGSETAQKACVVPCRVTAVFDISVPSHVSDADIEAEAKRVLQAAGITTLSSVSVER